MYEIKHIYFLQHMLHVGCVEHNEALRIINVLNEGENNDDGLENLLSSFISEINSKISQQKLKILKTICEVTDKEFVVLINLSDSDVYKHQVTFKHLELEYFQVLLKEIIESENKKLKQNIVLNISTTLTAKLSHTAAESLLEKWFECGYLVSKNGYVHLGPRCVQEFMSHFITTYKDYVTSCNLCSEITLMGKSCFYCRQTMHVHCLERFLRKHKRCPNCKNEWSEADKPENHESMEADSDLSADLNNDTMNEDEDSVPKPRKIRRKE